MKRTAGSATARRRSHREKIRLLPAAPIPAYPARQSTPSGAGPALLARGRTARKPSTFGGERAEPAGNISEVTRRVHLPQRNRIDIGDRCHALWRAAG